MNDKLKSAWEHYRRGNINAALNISTDICKSDTASAESYYLLGSCYARLEKYIDALHNFEISHDLDGKKPYTHVAIATALYRTGKFNKAIKFYQRAIQLNPATYEAYMGLADILSIQKKFDKARVCYMRAAKCQPHSGLPHFHLGMLAIKAGKPDLEILEHFSSAVECQPEKPQFQIALGKFLLKLDRLEAAKSAFSAVLDTSPINPNALSGMLSIYVKSGLYTEAGRTLDRILAAGIYTSDVATAFLLVCRHIERCDEAVDYAQRYLTTSDIGPDTIIGVHMQIASVLDHQQRVEEAWQHIQIARNADTRPNSYDPIDHKKYIDRLISTFTPAAFMGLPRASVTHEERPIFIIGMPRSGTSLVEQILSAHPDVSGGGELTEISSILKSLSTEIKTANQWPECVWDLTTEDANMCAMRYLAHIDSVSATSRFVTDKMPHNFYALGLIRLLFPKAVIIHCRRHPLDTCVSIYFQNFLVGHEYAKNQFNLGTHYHQYQRLMQHWREVLPDGMLEIDYEKLVEEPEPMIASILEYCGLPWHDRCLQPHTLERRVSTASFDQVRQPIHTRSIGRWRRYENYLGEMKLGLDRGY